MDESRFLQGLAILACFITAVLSLMGAAKKDGLLLVLAVVAGVAAGAFFWAAAIVG